MKERKKRARVRMGERERGRNKEGRREKGKNEGREKYIRKKGTLDSYSLGLEYFSLNSLHIYYWRFL